MFQNRFSNMSKKVKSTSIKSDEILDLSIIKCLLFNDVCYSILIL